MPHSLVSLALIMCSRLCQITSLQSGIIDTHSRQFPPSVGRVFPRFARSPPICSPEATGCGGSVRGEDSRRRCRRSGHQQWQCTHLGRCVAQQGLYWSKRHHGGGDFIRKSLVSASWIVDICGVYVQDSLFEGTTPDPVSVSLEYLELCRMYPGTATLKTIQTHVRHFMEYQWCVTSSMDSALSVMFCSNRDPWFSEFRTELGQCASLDEIEVLLRVKVRRWRGLIDLSVAQGREGAIDEDTDIPSQRVDPSRFLDDELHDSNGVLELEK